MGASIGQSYKQTKELDGFPFNAVGETWRVKNMQGKYIVLRNEGVGLGVSEEELKEHFKLVGDYSYDSDYDVSEDCEDEYEEDEHERDDEEDEEVEEDSEEVSRFKSFLRKIGLSKS
ncbi:hypothetical protein [Paenibacillus agilis]|uniref:hypothetical protein n=1 Tax=Paenibacillus agilis TaxID=3020863 RepID=UPI001649B9F5|nr:hypothetical protein [Paenibacillus agilis]